MARSLSRSTKLFATTLTKANATVGNMTTANTYEIKVLDGYSFSQDASNIEVGVNEAGKDPVRGTLSFNTALNPVDVSFSTYVRPFDTGSAGSCVEKVLWGSAMGTATGWTNALAAGSPATFTTTATDITFGLETSNANELMPLTLFFVLENTTYTIEQFNVGSAEVDFSIDGIATINWSGQGSRVSEDTASHLIFKADGTAVSGVNYTAVPATTTSTFLRNKLSTLELVDNEVDTANTITGITITTITPNADGTTTLTLDAFTLAGTFTAANYVGGRIRNTALNPDEWATVISINDGSNTVTVKEDLSADGLNWVTTNAVTVYAATQSSAVIYSIPITGATLTLENNFTYLTPEELAIVNLPLGGFAGNRVTSGSFTAYLNTGAQGSGGLLQDMLAKIEQSVSNNYQLVFHMGGSSTDTPRVDFTIAHAQISVPTTSVEDIISTEISFTAKPWNAVANVGSFEATNELIIAYEIP